MSGVAFSGGGVNVTLLAFDETSHVLSTWDTVNNQLGAFQHGPFTQHVPGFITHGIPPNPCDGFIHAYNALVEQQARAGASPRAALISTQLYVTIAHLSAAHCDAAITSDTAGNLLSFQPYH